MPSDVWPINRRWAVLRDDQDVDVTTLEFADSKATIMLGAAGLGKTFELNRLAQYEQELGRDVKRCRLAEHSGSRDELHGHLSSLSATANANTSIFLDALDESRVPLPRAGLVVAGWIGSSLVGTGARLRITCRSAVWPGDVQQALDTYTGATGCLKGFLRDLTEADVIAAASALGIDAPRHF